MHRRDFIFAAPTLVAIAAGVSKETIACPGTDFVPSEYVSRKNLKNWVLGGFNEYMSKHYPDLPRVLLQQPEFSIWTRVIPENSDVIPVRINLPNHFRPFSLNNVGRQASNLKCVGVEVICEGGKIDRARHESDPTYPANEIFSNGTYQVCSFDTPGQELSEIEFRYRRWEESRLIAIARMATTHDSRPTIALIATTEYLKNPRCGGPIFVDA